MQLCGANNIVNYHFSYYYKSLLFMFVEYMNEGCLTDFIFQYIERIPEDVIIYILKEILIGLGALHCRRQIHRDLKSDNILINSAG
jgi:serine/threonine protein kinase